MRASTAVLHRLQHVAISSLFTLVASFTLIHTLVAFWHDLQLNLTWAKKTTCDLTKYSLRFDLT